MRQLFDRFLPVVVQIALVSVVLAGALIPFGSPLPELDRSAAVIGWIAAVLLILSVAALAAMTLVVRWRRFGSTTRILAASVVGLLAAGTLFGGLSGFLARPLLLLAALALVVIAVPAAVVRAVSPRR